ncbi:DNA adenine methylase [Acetobacter fallax]|uniref:site-specific DNA-methyltransferase (adenine-specific) n=1 Tax=Acetobacter fallax TaxID=1737473 RepID=A0ABX0KB14_9PROT|nr:DNA adenine methylase [Acetobacter fallax]NHO33346.1 DNA adenine methylase [Acetobacter fallax]NHO36967.1 DNA adenine methylase [Acetobacter fallax]
MKKEKSVSALPPAPYIGGKRNLASVLTRLISRIEHRVYIEPFVGMGGVFFRRKTAAQVEVINDYNGEVANLFRVLQRHLIPLTDMLRWQITSRAHFDRLKVTDPVALTDLERAVRFLYLQRIAYAGQVRGQHFSPATRSSRFDVRKLVPMLEDVHQRLAGVTIECRPYSDILTRYDRPDVLFYLDPPYFGTEDYYDAPFTPDDFGRLADLLAHLKGAFVLSINDQPEVRDIFRAFEAVPVVTRWSSGTGSGKLPLRGELVISNRALTDPV